MRFLNHRLQPFQATIDDSLQTEHASTFPQDISAFRINGNDSTDDEKQQFELIVDEDVPRPTENGGYTHTRSSKAKISAANKGKTPWNKGQQRSEDVKARIAEGVRRKNRLRFLQKLEDLGITEEEYNEQKKQERAAKERERRARRTEKGGYLHTPETRQKLSAVLKEKYASGEIDGKRNVDPSKVRRGFKHSEETRAKISASLKKRWSEDPEYRATMLAKTTAGNTQEHVRKKISETLKKKWQDKEFRAAMLEKMATKSVHRQLHSAKISSAMKAKWQDAEYRKRTLDAIAKQPRKATTARGTNPRRRVSKAANDDTTPSQISAESLRKLRPRGVREAEIKVTAKKKKKASSPTPTQTASKRRTVSKRTPKVPTVFEDDNNDDEDELFMTGEHVNGPSKPKKKSKAKNGDKEKLREDRRDLYDFLYGDEEGSQSKLASVFALGDEDLDEFDPYGLEDF